MQVNTGETTRATHYNVITEICKALITIACKTISFFALKVQHNLAQGKRTVYATPWGKYRVSSVCAL